MGHLTHESDVGDLWRDKTLKTSATSLDCYARVRCAFPEAAYAVLTRKMPALGGTLRLT